MSGVDNCAKHVIFGHAEWESVGHPWSHISQTVGSLDLELKDVSRVEMETHPQQLKDEGA